MHRMSMPITRQGGRIKAPEAPRPMSRRPAQPDDGLEDEAVLRGLTYSGTIFAGAAAEAVEADGCLFESVRFTGADLKSSQIGDSFFTTCDFAQLAAHEVSLIRCTVTGCRITGSSWKSCMFRDVRFEGCRSDPAMYRYSKLYAVVFSDCKLQGADFQQAQLHNVLFENCDLTGAQFANVTVGSVRFDNCTLLDIGGAASLKGATVRGPGAMELALSLAREAGIVFEP